MIFTHLLSAVIMHFASPRWERPVFLAALGLENRVRADGMVPSVIPKHA